MSKDEEQSTKPIRNWPPESERLFEQMIALWNEGKVEDALQIGDQLIKLEPESAAVNGIIGMIHLDSKQPKIAIGFCEKAVAKSPRSELASLGLFHSLWSAEAINQAMDEIQRFICANPASEIYDEIIAEIKDKWDEDLRND